MARLIVCDASALIGWLDPADAHHQQAVDSLTGTAGDQLAASTLTIAEVLVGAHRAGRADAVRAALDGIGISEVGLDGRASELARLRASVGLPLPDCGVLLAAQAAGAAAVLGFDARLATAARALGLETIPG